MHSPSKKVNQSTASNPAAPYSLTEKEEKDLRNIIQNFYSKTAQIIVQGRLPTSDTKRPSIKEQNFSSKKRNKWFNIVTEETEDVNYWKSLAVAVQENVPPMFIHIYLDTSRLAPNQKLLAADDNLRWGFVDVLHVNRILIETWVLKLKHPISSRCSEGLPSLYKHSIVFFRALHSFVRLLPTYELYRKMRKANKENILSIGYRLSSYSSAQYGPEMPLNSVILENDARIPTNSYKFSEIATPNGVFQLGVTYRRNCDFRVEDKERDLGAQSIDMDEQFFSPAKQTSVALEKPICSRNPGEQPPKPKASTSSSSRHSTTSRAVPPFKSSTLSSPQADTSLASSIIVSKPTTLDSSGCGSFRRKLEFMPSFEKYKSNMTSSSSLSTIKRIPSQDFILNEDEDGLGEFLRFVIPRQDLRSFRRSPSMTLLSTDASTGSEMTNSSSITTKRAALSHFQSLRDIHTSLSDSLSSSMMIATRDGSPVSSISSMYQPVIPSPLQADQNPLQTAGSNMLRITDGSFLDDKQDLSKLAYPQNRSDLAESLTSTGNNFKNKEAGSFDDDDSLVFDMVEIGCESSVQRRNQSTRPNSQE